MSSRHYTTDALRERALQALRECARHRSGVWVAFDELAAHPLVYRAGRRMIAGALRSLRLRGMVEYLRDEQGAHGRGEGLWRMVMECEVPFNPAPEVKA